MSELSLTALGEFMQERPAADFDEAPALSWAVLARQYAVLAAENGALRAELQALQHRSQGRRWRPLPWARQAVRLLLSRGMRSVRFIRDRWRQLSRLTSAPALARGGNLPPARPAQNALRVVYIGDRGPYETSSMRYRAHNLIEALLLHDTASTFVAEEELSASFDEVLAHDLIVLVRRRWNPKVKALIGAARQAAIPLVYDLDDFLFDPWVLPYIDSARGRLAPWTVQYIKDLRATLQSCDFFTGSTAFLVEQAALCGKPGWVIRNGLNATQLAGCRAALQNLRPAPADGLVRLGYFSGTKTHQADFRVAYPALVRILQGFEQARLAIVGELDLHEFPGLEPFAAQIDQRPCVDWRELPSLIATVDLNLVPLDVNPYTQGKSDLKYFEAGILKVPTIASPTQVFTSCIRHGETGWLAGSDQDWYRGLKLLLTEPVLRRRLGEKAYAHVQRHCVPSVIASEAVAAYQQILRGYRDLPKTAA